MNDVRGGEHPSELVALRAREDEAILAHAPNRGAEARQRDLAR